ncbi:NADH-quinone oxidoreductase subunit L [Pseudodonghicola xiamenensis]|uniref:NADH-quinone oxidoreductase subunit L n=1 Tax=Pseudodonghicola xiamenensis TaxID=337702 RepID=A0A8J3MBA9_9RHOB|nr:NADH-quinone oxidoreductase subunit L [Pseudodonghicola xiamenensis]GHG79338.1 NADH-quinone oxidoreductase subunit L [Pseudodonghicola xiamenensis]
METIILFAPLVGAILAGFGWKIIGETAAQWLTTGLLFLSCILSWIVFINFDGVTHTVEIFRYIESGSLSTSWSIRLDRLTAIMLIVVTSVSAFVHLYSFGYMAHDPAFKDGESYKPRFFAYLSLFTFAMLMLVTSDNLVQMFFGWEGVGLASYLLIGFYYRKPSAGAAAMKAFVVNRVGDFGFSLAMFALFFLTDSIAFGDVFVATPELAQTKLNFLWGEWTATEVIAILLFIGAMGKSAQLFLHTWLPDAMEGPTPVSALIHAATMVTAGVFLVCRMSPVMEFAPHATAFITVLGALTAFVAATIGLVQTDIKRVIAYSTMSQLGYMFVAAGVGVYSAAMFHLLTHAFFKALLFLCAGSVIHAMHHEQDMRNYGGLRKKIPFTFWTMILGTLAITGVGIPMTEIGFAGFLSKDAIIESAWAGGSSFGFWMLVIAAAFTAFYSWRLIFLTFFGAPRGDKHAHDHAHESPTVMLVPLGVLSLGAIFAGMLWYGNFFGHADEVGKFYGIPVAEASAHGETAGAHEETAAAAHGETATATHGETTTEAPAAEAGTHHVTFAGEPGQGALYISPDNHVLDIAHTAPAWVKVSPFIAMLSGLLVAIWFYLVSPSLPKKLAESQRPLYLFLLNKWYFDEIYDAVLVKPALALGRLLWKRGDGNIIDGFLNGVALGIIPFFTRLAGRAQSGYIFTYVFWMVLGMAALVTWMTIGGGAH